MRVVVALENMANNGAIGVMQVNGRGIFVHLKEWGSQ